jgi:hypothetical protein
MSVQVAVIGKDAVVVAVAESGAVVEASWMYLRICTRRDGVVEPVPPVPPVPPVRQLVVEAVVPMDVVPNGSVGGVGGVGHVGTVGSAGAAGPVSLVVAVEPVVFVGLVTDVGAVGETAARVGTPPATSAMPRSMADPALARAKRRRVFIKVIIGMRLIYW